MTMNVICSGKHVLGKLSRNLDKSSPRNCQAILTWELREQEAGKVEFSACGEVWNHIKSDIITGGQCVDTLADLFPHDKKAGRIRETWERYHLNGMNAGTPEQSAAIKAWEAAGNRYDYTAACNHLESIGLLDVPITDELRAAALGGLPDGAETYRYGSRWLHYALPESVLDLIRSGFNS